VERESRNLEMEKMRFLYLSGSHYCGDLRLCCFGDTRTFSFLCSSPSLRFAGVREGQYRARARVSELLVNASIEVLDQFVDDCEPASPLNICRSRAIVCHAAFDKLAGAP